MSMEEMCMVKIGKLHTSKRKNKAGRYTSGHKKTSGHGVGGGF